MRLEATGLFQPENVMPSQWYPEQGRQGAEYRLLYAVLFDALKIIEFYGQMDRTGGEGRKHFAEALTWLRDGRSGRLLAARTVCELLEIDYDGLVGRVEKWLASPKAMRGRLIPDKRSPVIPTARIRPPRERIR